MQRITYHAAICDLYSLDHSQCYLTHPFWTIGEGILSMFWTQLSLVTSPRADVSRSYYQSSNPIGQHFIHKVYVHM